MTTLVGFSQALADAARDAGLTIDDLATRAGVSPARVDAVLGNRFKLMKTWLALVAAMRCRLAMVSATTTIQVSVPRISPVRRTRQIEAWRRHQFAAFLSQARRQSPHLPEEVRHAQAQTWMSSSLQRVVKAQGNARSRLEELTLTSSAPGMRAAIQQIAKAAGVLAEELALLAGVSEDATRQNLQADEDGRLAVVHQIASALLLRIQVLPCAGGAIELAHAQPGAWHPDTRHGRCTLTKNEIVRRRAAGETLASIGRDGGVSRQRIHQILKVQTTTGRTEAPT